MLKIINEDTKCGGLDNKSFFEMLERILSIIKVIGITDSYTLDSFSEISAQTQVILTAIGIIEGELVEHINNYIDTDIEEVTSNDNHSK